MVRCATTCSQQLETLAPLLDPNIDGDPGDIAAWPRHARHDASLDRKSEDADDRNCRRCRLQVENEGSVDGKDQIRIATHDVAGQIRIVRGTPFAVISPNQEILSLDVP